MLVEWIHDILYASVQTEPASATNEKLRYPCQFEASRLDLSGDVTLSVIAWLELTAGRN